MTEEELEEIIEKARIFKYSELNLNERQVKSLPKSICNLTHLKKLNLADNQLIELPDSIGNLAKLTFLGLHGNQLNYLPYSIGNLSKLTVLDLSHNRLTNLPISIEKLSKLSMLGLSGNPLTDLSILKVIPKPDYIHFLNTYIPSKYWTKLSEWNPLWLINEGNAELRRTLIHQIGYERVIRELNIDELDNWREYSLLKIDNVENFYDEDIDKEITEPMVLLKMICPSTGHIHILRVPPAITSAEAAITWVNHGIHPDKFTVQT